MCILCVRVYSVLMCIYIARTAFKITLTRTHQHAQLPILLLCNLCTFWCLSNQIMFLKSNFNDPPQSLSFIVYVLSHTEPFHPVLSPSSSTFLSLSLSHPHSLPSMASCLFFFFFFLGFGLSVLLFCCFFFRCCYH